MKRPFSPKHNRSSVGYVAGVVVVLAVGFILLLLRIFLPDAFISLAAPFWKAGTAMDVGTGNWFTGLTHGSSLAAQNQMLSSEVTTLENENAVLTARTQDLTKLLGSQPAQTGGAIVAGILARPPLSPYDTLVVAAGAQDGISKGAEVFAQGGVPIGTVESTSAHSATIHLLSTPNTTTNGWIGNDRLALTLTGTGSGTFSSSLPKNTPISVGDTVYIPGPGAIPMGTVTRVDSDPSSPNDTLHIQPLVNIFSLTWVTIAS